jgi:E3 ubiquitin-protein ligase SIAH1
MISLDFLFSSIQDSVSIGLTMASAAYLDDTDAEVIDPPKNEMLDVAELVGDLIQHSPKPNMIVSSNVRELLECPVCLVAMYPPIHQVCLVAELLPFSWSILVASYW